MDGPIDTRATLLRVARNFYDFVWAVIDRAILAQVDTQAAQIAFNAVFAIAPLMTLASILISLIPAEVMHASIDSTLSPYLPEQVRPLLDAQLNVLLQRPSHFLVIVTIIGFLWTISSATGSISAALGVVGWRLHPQWLKRKLQAMILGVVMAAGLALLAVSASIVPWVNAHATRLELLSDVSVFLIVWTRWPLAGLVFSLASALFYRFGTLDRPHPRAVLLGGFLSGLTAVLASLLLRVYFSFAPYLGGMVGSAFTVFAGLLWLYALALGMMIGAVAAYVYEAEARGVVSELVPLLKSLPISAAAVISAIPSPFLKDGTTTGRPEKLGHELASRAVKAAQTTYAGRAIASTAAALSKSVSEPRHDPHDVPPTHEGDAFLAEIASPAPSSLNEALDAESSLASGGPVRTSQEEHEARGTSSPRDSRDEDAEATTSKPAQDRKLVRGDLL